MAKKSLSGTAKFVAHSPKFYQALNDLEPNDFILYSPDPITGNFALKPVHLYNGAPPDFTKCILSIVPDPIEYCLRKYIKDAQLEELDNFIKLFHHSQILDWFDHNWKTTLGFDVYTRPFNQDLGLTLYKDNGRRLLIATQHSLYLLTSLAHKTSRPTMKVVLPEWFINLVYNSRYVRHFFNESYIEGMQAQWR